MLKNKSPIMLSYIIFLFICLIYYIGSKAFNFQFDAWERIIIAATIASYFFTFSFCTKSVVKIGCKAREYYKTEYDFWCSNIEVSLQIKDDEKENENKTDDSRLKKINSMIDSISSDITKYEKLTFRFNVLGFLVFFVILTFDPISSWLSKLQEMFTLIAFVLILLVEYLEPIYYEKLENSKKELVQVFKNL